MLTTTMTIAILLLFPTLATSLAFENNLSDRRKFVEAITSITKTTATVGLTCLLETGMPSATFAAPSKLISRLEQDILNLPAPSYTSELNGVDNTYFPSYMAGTWNVTQTLIDTKAPLGLKYLGGPNGDLTIAGRTIQESQSQLNRPVQLQLRYLNTKWGVAEDRLFNNKARLNAFAGKPVVANVQYANVGGSNRQSVLALGGTESDPLQTTVVYFKGPAAQKSFLVSHGGETITTSSSSTTNLSSWVGYELQRSIFALTNQNTAPPVTTDTEYIWRFDPIDNDTVYAKLRIAGYLNAQSDKLYFETRNRAVSLQDYDLVMKRVN